MKKLFAFGICEAQLFRLETLACLCFKLKNFLLYSKKLKIETSTRYSSDSNNFNTKQRRQVCD